MSFSVEFSKSCIFKKILLFREQDKEWGKIAVTRQIFTLSERFAKWDTHLARTKKAPLFSVLGTRNGNQPRRGGLHGRREAVIRT